MTFLLNPEAISDITFLGCDIKGEILKYVIHPLALIVKNKIINHRKGEIHIFGVTNVCLKNGLRDLVYHGEKPYYDMIYKHKFKYTIKDNLIFGRPVPWETLPILPLPDECFKIDFSNYHMRIYINLPMHEDTWVAKANCINLYFSNRGGLSTNPDIFNFPKQQLNIIRTDNFFGTKRIITTCQSDYIKDGNNIDY